jgi:hypothetical protein
MRMARALLICGAFVLAGAVSPALAGCNAVDGHCWQHAHRIIYHMHNHIAFLEADPNADDGFKGPIIDHLHRKILRIRAAIGPRWPHWPTPCCYSRRPIYIR